jgi:arylformamidase
MNCPTRHYVCLSHELCRRTPHPADLPGVAIEPLATLPRDASNVFSLRLCNHIGTHIDGPKHFDAAKPPLSAWPLESFVFHRVAVCDVPKGDGQLITEEDLQAAGQAIGNHDLLLFRTGFGAVREADPGRYRDAGPGLSAAAAEHIVQHLPAVKAIGIDSLSLACPRHLEDGLQAHRILMSPAERYVFIIEDMNLQHDLTGVRAVYALPLRCEQLDSAPCTVLAEGDRQGDENRTGTGPGPCHSKEERSAR